MDELTFLSASVGHCSRLTSLDHTNYTRKPSVAFSTSFPQKKLEKKLVVQSIPLTVEPADPKLNRLVSCHKFCAGALPQVCHYRRQKGYS